jgi:hypothetical protein
MALQPRATLSAKGNGFITGKSLPHSLFDSLVNSTLLHHFWHRFVNVYQKFKRIL